MISVILPTYNRDKTLKKSVESVLQQTYEDIELIIVDDGSKDTTFAVVKSIKDHRIRYVTMDRNRGACAARNRGIELAKGQYISFQDSDDIWFPNKLELQLSNLKESGSDITFCRIQTFKPDGSIAHIAPNEKQPCGAIPYNTFLSTSMVSTQTILGKSECFKEISFDADIPRLQDWDIILRLSQRYNIFYQPEILVKSHIMHDSISMSPNKGVIAIKIIMKKHMQNIDKNPNLKAHFMYRLGNFLLLDGKNPTREFACAFLIKPKLKVFFKMVISAIGLNKVFKMREIFINK